MSAHELSRRDAREVVRDFIDERRAENVIGPLPCEVPFHELHLRELLHDHGTGIAELRHARGEREIARILHREIDNVERLRSRAAQLVFAGDDEFAGFRLGISMQTRLALQRHRVQLEVVYARIRSAILRSDVRHQPRRTELVDEIEFGDIRIGPQLCRRVAGHLNDARRPLPRIGKKQLARPVLRRHERKDAMGEVLLLHGIGDVGHGRINRKREKVSLYAGQRIRAVERVALARMDVVDVDARLARGNGRADLVAGAEHRESVEVEHLAGVDVRNTVDDCLLQFKVRINCVFAWHRVTSLLNLQGAVFVLDDSELRKVLVGEHGIPLLRRIGIEQPFQCRIIG